MEASIIFCALLVFGSVEYSQNETCHSRPCYPFETPRGACRVDVTESTHASMLVQRPGSGGMSRRYHLSRLNHKQQTGGLKLETLQGFKYMTGRFELPIGMEGSLRGTTRRSEALILNSNRTIPVPPGICSHSAVSET